MNILNLGIVGACGRGGSFKAACDAIAELRVHAVCDINQAELEETRLRLGASEAYVDFEEMLEKSDLDAVLVGTPMPLHVPQAILALQQNLHVLSEVPASVSIEECQRLVQVYKASQGLYMMAENYPYRKNNAIVREIVRQGLFGVPY
jgi:predicted dehydrogenase